LQHTAIFLYEFPFTFTHTHCERGRVAPRVTARESARSATTTGPRSMLSLSSSSARFRSGARRHITRHTGLGLAPGQTHSLTAPVVIWTRLCLSLSRSLSHDLRGAGKH